MSLNVMIIAFVISLGVGVGATWWEKRGRAWWDDLGKAHDEIEKDSLHRH